MGARSSSIYAGESWPDLRARLVREASQLSCILAFSHTFINSTTSSPPSQELKGMGLDLRYETVTSDGLFSMDMAVVWRSKWVGSVD